LTFPTYSPAESAAGLAGFRPAAAPQSRDPIVELLAFPGCFVQARVVSVKDGKVLGTSLQKGKFNSKVILLNLIKSLENRRKLEKIQTWFC
jgi:hypothetical protein